MQLEVAVQSGDPVLLAGILEVAREVTELAADRGIEVDADIMALKQQVATIQHGHAPSSALYAGRPTRTFHYVDCMPTNAGSKVTRSFSCNGNQGSSRNTRERTCQIRAV